MDLSGTRVFCTESTAVQGQRNQSRWREGEKRGQAEDPRTKLYKVNESCVSHIRWDSGFCQKVKLQPMALQLGKMRALTLNKGGCYRLRKNLRCPVHRGLTLIIQPSTYGNDCSVSKKPHVLQRISSANTDHVER